MSSPFDEARFNDDIFSTPSFTDREQIIEEKRKMFEECESEEFKRNKEQMMARLKEQREKQQQNNYNSSETVIEEVTEIPDDQIQKELNTRNEETEEEQEEEEILTAEEIIQLVEEATEHKNSGNEYYKEERWEAAIQEYSRALNVCPKSEKIRSVFYANRAACWRNLLEYEKSAEDCTEAIKLDDKYEKVYLRRADSYEKLDKLSEALEGNLYFLD